MESRRLAAQGVRESGHPQAAGAAAGNAAFPPHRVFSSQRATWASEKRLFSVLVSRPLWDMGDVASPSSGICLKEEILRAPPTGKAHTPPSGSILFVKQKSQPLPRCAGRLQSAAPGPLFSSPAAQPAADCRPESPGAPRLGPGRGAALLEAFRAWKSPGRASALGTWGPWICCVCQSCAQCSALSP